MTYPIMVQDLLKLLDGLQLKQVTIIGYSIGSKAAMALTDIAPHRIDKLIVIYLAPVPRTLPHSPLRRNF